ncbi:methyltransferase domain-containing protein [Aeromonas sobria]|uniref:methyltransferase domain-containing protein n=1 Tax=Aeromonas sobria TaxID=646 RepID=UPI000C6D932B|nr:methyltransferase dimerization domain-containing protein [Aeromonas sobria]PKQ71367.1 hypothetical protein CJF47_20665 [Aeromonas sobria]
MNSATKNLTQDSPANTHKLDQEQINSWDMIFNIATGFRASLILIEATNLGYFNCDLVLESYSDVSKRLGISSTGAKVLLDALCSMGLVNKTDELYLIDKKIHTLFNQCNDRNITYNISAFKNELQVWMRMAEILKGNSSRTPEYSNELFFGQIKKFSGLSMFNRIDAESILPTVAKHIKTNDTIIDFGGGEGYYAKRLSEMAEFNSYSIVDIENSFCISEEINKPLISSGKLIHITSDARYFSSTKKYNLVLMNELTELFPIDEKKLIVDNAISCLSENGYLIITKFPMDESGTGPGRFPIFSMRMFLKFNEAYLEKDSDLIDYITSKGLHFENIYHKNRTIIIFKKIKKEEE